MNVSQEELGNVLLNLLNLDLTPEMQNGWGIIIVLLPSVQIL